MTKCKDLFSIVDEAAASIPPINMCPSVLLSLISIAEKIFIGKKMGSMR